MSTKGAWLRFSDAFLKFFGLRPYHSGPRTADPYNIYAYADADEDKRALRVAMFVTLLFHVLLFVIRFASGQHIFIPDNTFQNGIGRDTTLIGNFLTGTLTRRFSSSLETTLGVFAAMPFGHDTEISRVNPILRLDYRPREDATAILGTLMVPHDRFFDAIFDDANRWVRPSHA